jgi:hypothetical protein
MLVKMNAAVLGFAAGDVADLPRDHPGLSGALSGRYAERVSKSEAKALGVDEPLSAAESDANDDDAPDSAADAAEG